MNPKKLLIGVSTAIVGICLLWYLFARSQPSDDFDRSASVVTTTSQTNTGTAAISENSIPETPAQTVAEDLPDESVSRLSRVPGFGHNFERDEKRFSEEEMQREEIISDCMRQQGYEYEPAPSIVVDDSFADQPEALERMLAEASNNPNDRYLLSLSEDERRAYYEALTGVADPNNPEAEVYDLAIQSDSCTSRAIRAVPGVYAAYNALREEFDAIEVAVSEDSSVVTAIAAWSDCMSAAGYQYDHPREMAQSHDQILSEIPGADAPEAEVLGSAIRLQRMAGSQEAASACGRSMALNPTYTAARVKHENHFFEQYRQLLTPYTSD